jgi:hypothetical protein
MAGRILEKKEEKKKEEKKKKEKRKGKKEKKRTAYANPAATSGAATMDGRVILGADNTDTSTHVRSSEPKPATRSSTQTDQENQTAESKMKGRKCLFESGSLHGVKYILRISSCGQSSASEDIQVLKGPEQEIELPPRSRREVFAKGETIVRQKRKQGSETPSVNGMPSSLRRSIRERRDLP